MCFSLPIVVSETCGCSADLVQENINGFKYKEGDIEFLSGLLEKLIDDDKMRQSFGRESLNIIKAYSNSHTVKNMKEALE